VEQDAQEVGHEEGPLPPEIVAGMACTSLIAYPDRWINRRVETVELLSYEETRRRVSVDYTLDEPAQTALELADGVVVPITVLTKEPRRNFDLRDEGGRSVPVLGKSQNGNLAHIALVNAALNALPQTPSQDAFEMLAADLRRIVLDTRDEAADTLAYLIGAAEADEPVRQAVWGDETCRRLLTTLSENYVLFAVLPPGGATRRVLKYGYGDDFSRQTEAMPLRDKLRPAELLYRVVSPERQRFVIRTPGANRGVSFHVEVAIPAELRVTAAFLYDLDTAEPVSGLDTNVNRASLYAPDGVHEGGAVDAYLEVAPERAGRTIQAAATSVVVAALLWLGVASGLDARNPGPAVALILAGAALFSGFTAAQGAHRIVRDVFWPPRLWLGLVSLCALAASATLAMEYPSQHPVSVWRWAGIACTVAAVRLCWSAIRAPA
jgi:hypothetical protein